MRTTNNNQKMLNVIRNVVSVLRTEKIRSKSELYKGEIRTTVRVLFPSINHLTALLALLLFCSMTGCDKERAILPSGRVVKIGVIAPLSGIDEEVGKSGLAGVRVAVSMQPYLNNGDKVELVIEDDESSPEKTEDAFDSLKKSDVVGVILLSKSNSALHLAKKNRWMRTPVVATIATHSELTHYSSYITQISFDDTFQGKVAAMFMRDELLLSRAVVVSCSDDSHSSVLAAKFIEQFKATQGIVDEHIVLSSPTETLLAQLQEAEKDGVEFLYLPVQSETVLHVAQTLKKMHWKPVIMASDGLLSEIMLKHEGSLSMIDGMVATDMHSSILAKTEYGEAIHDLFTDQNRKRGSTFTVLGSEGTSILMHALNKAKAPYKPLDVKTQLKQIRNFETFSGIISIDNNGKAIRPIYVTLIKGKELKLIAKVY